MARSEHFALHRSELPLQSDSVAKANESGRETKDMLSEPRSWPLFPVLDLWMGAMVPKRWAKRAVTRNAIKRQIYTVSAVFSPQHRQAAFVVRLRRDFSRKVYLSASSDQLKQVVRSELLSLMRDGARHA